LDDYEAKTIMCDLNWFLRMKTFVEEGEEENCVQSADGDSTLNGKI
jgi:hypothetical protein